MDRRVQVVGGTLVFIVGFWLLAVGLAPSGGWRDITEFQWAAGVLGIPHPPGSPVPALLGRLASLIPLGAIAWRVNWFSSVAGSVALALAYVLAVEVMLIVRPGLSARLAGGGALAAPVVLLGSPVYREHAATAEVYALQTALAAALAWLWIRVAVAPRRRDVRPLASLALLAAVSIGVHVSFAFYLAGMSLWFAVRERPWIGPRAASAIASVVVLAGFTFAYVPIRAHGHPSINWGDPVTFDRLRYHLTDQKDWEAHEASKPAADTTAATSSSRAGTVERIDGITRRLHAMAASTSMWGGFVGGYVRDEVGRVTAGLAILGLVALLACAPVVASVFVVLIASHLAFAIPIGKWANPTGYNPVYLLVSVLACAPVGWALGIARVRRRDAAAWCLVLVSLVPSAERLARAWSRVGSLAEDFRADELSREMMRPLPPDTILLAAHLWPLFGYLREVEGYRTDVDVVFRNEIYETQRMRLDPTRVSAIVIPEPGDGLETRADRVARMRAFLEVNARVGRSLAWQSEADDLYYRVRPAGLLFAYEPPSPATEALVPTAETSAALDRWLASFEPSGSRRFWLQEADDFEEAVLPVARYAGWQAAHLACDDALLWWTRIRRILEPARVEFSWTAALADLIRLCPEQRAAQEAGASTTVGPAVSPSPAKP